MVNNKKSKRGKNKKEKSSMLSNLSSEFKDGLKEGTRRIVKSAVFLIFAFILGFSAIGKAGMFGEYVFQGVYYLIGLGYYILPLIFIFLSIASLISLEEKIPILKKISIFIFILSTLGLIEMFLETSGGIVGSLIIKGLGYLFDFYLSGLLLSIFAIISLFIIFDFDISTDFLRRLKNIFSFKKKSDSDTDTEDDQQEEDFKKKEEETTKEEAMELEEEKETQEEEKIKSNNRKSEEEKIEKKSKEIEISPLSLQSYSPPPVSLLSSKQSKPSVGDIKANANLIKRTLQNFGIDTEIDEISIGPSVTRYAIKPAEGIRLSKIISLQSNLELALASHPVRIEAPIPGRSLVGIEVPNSARATVSLGGLLGSNEFQNAKNALTIALGKSISGHLHFGNIAKMPHILIAGATGAGKSVTIHSIITSLLYKNSPENLRLIMVDPKHVELTLYKNIPHLLTPVITDPKKAILALKWAGKEMERRYNILEAETVRDISSYHKNVLAPAKVKAQKQNFDESSLPEAMPYIVIVMDEIADIMHTYPRELESAIVRLAQMSRAVGIHLVLSTQRPSVNIITGLIKANIPARIALQVSSQVDSRTILDSGGAERLLGAGDMLYLSGEMGKPQRLQSAFVSENEVKAVAKYLRNQYEDELPNEIQLTENGENDKETNIFDEIEREENEDDMYEDAREIVIKTGRASTSYLQRRLRVGYARAARLMDILEERGVVSPGDGAKAREVFIKEEDDGYNSYKEESVSTSETVKNETEPEDLFEDEEDDEKEKEDGDIQETESEDGDIKQNSDERYI